MSTVSEWFLVNELNCHSLLSLISMKTLDCTLSSVLGPALLFGLFLFSPLDTGPWPTASSWCRGPQPSLDLTSTHGHFRNKYWNYFLYFLKSKYVIFPLFIFYPRHFKVFFFLLKLHLWTIHATKHVRPFPTGVIQLRLESCWQFDATQLASEVASTSSLLTQT